MVQSKIVMRLLFELCQHLLIVCLYPPGRGDADGFELAVNFVFIFQSMSNDLELQGANCAKYQLIVSQWLKQLGRTLFTQLRETLVQRLQEQWIL